MWNQGARQAHRHALHNTAKGGTQRSSEPGKVFYGTARNEPEPEGASYEDMARALVKTRRFDVVIGVCILMNAISIGVEQSLQVEGYSTLPVQILESLFLCVYICELGIRLLGYGLDCFHDNWVKFDFFLIVIGILNTWILEPSLEDSPDALGLLMVLRVLRLLRLAKSARLLKRISEFWRLIRGFLNSATIMLYTLLIVVLVMYVFSSLGVELITKHKLARGANPDAAFQAQVDQYFCSLPQTMITLLRFVTLDEMSIVYAPLIDKDPWLVIYFSTLILVVSIVLMNLVAAVIFSSTLEQEQDEHDEIQRAQEDEWASLIRNLKDMFIRLDVDASGQLSRDEVMCMDPSDRDILVAALGVSTPEKVFNALDIDGNGLVSINEFFDGIWDVALAKGNVDLKRLEKQVETMHWRMKETFSIQHDMRLTIDRAMRLLESLSEQSGDIRSNVTVSTGGGSYKGGTMPLDMPGWAQELDVTMKQFLKHMHQSTTSAQRTSCSMAWPDRDTNQNDAKSFREHLKEKCKGGKSAEKLDKFEGTPSPKLRKNSPASRQTSPAARQTSTQSVTSVITAVKMESTLVDSDQPVSPLTPSRTSRMRRNSIETEEIRALAARLTEGGRLTQI